MKLNQALAIRKGENASRQAAVEKAYHLLQKSDAMEGLEKVYSPINDEGEVLPRESKRLQLHAEDILDSVQTAFIQLMNANAVVEFGNLEATANIVLGDKVLIAGCPVTYMLFLEKTLKDLETIINKIPVLDPAETWTYDGNVGAYVTAPKQTTSTKKVQVAVVVVPATDKHPAQVSMTNEDKTQGHWNRTLFSGAVSSTRKAELNENVQALMTAVKIAREEANSIEVEKQDIAKVFLDSIFTSPSKNK